MEEQFAPYEIALKLKELYFDEECLAWYVSKEYGLEIGKVKQADLIKDAIIAPLYQQAFDFFREKYNLDSEIYLNHDFNCKKIYTYLILQLNGNIISHKCSTTDQYNNHKEAQIACLKKLIEICKL